MSDQITEDGKYRILKTLAPEPVDGTCCLWFAWAPAGFLGPKEYPNGREGEECRPKRVVIEGDEVDAVRVCVQPGTEASEWHHGSAADDRGNANGRTKTQISNPEYQSPDYNSQLIQPLNTNLCKLVAMTSPDAPPTANVEQIPVGVGPVIIDVPGDAPKTLWLGMHDAFEWNNNGGTQMVVVEALKRIV